MMLSVECNRAHGNGCLTMVPLAETKLLGFKHLPIGYGGASAEHRNP